MSFERRAVQKFFEGKLGCNDLRQWKSYRGALQAYTLSATDATVLAPLLRQDALALYIQALQSFAQALNGIQRKEFAWPIVKLYYSIFYAMRGELHAASIISVKNGNIYYMANNAGAAFSSVQEKGSHQTYIKLRKNMPPSVIAHDSLLDNEIEARVDVYSWMCSNRERVNYHAKHFPDPEPDDVLQKVYINYVKKHRLTDLLNLYEADILYCFDKDHATIAAPYKKLRSCRDMLYGRIHPDAIEDEKLATAKGSLISVGISSSVADRLML